MSFIVAGIGELLWDEFAEWRRMGGAPVNFAFHCRQLGARAYPVSCVGADPDGREIMTAIAELGLPTDYIEEQSSHPTGRVRVELDAEGKPRYEIAGQSAWDFVSFSEALWNLAARTDAVCFGTLAQRGRVSREAIQRFVHSCPEHALRIFDVNLRQAFYDASVIEASLRLANVLKISDEELPVLARMFDLGASVDSQVSKLMDRFGLRLVAYTRGGRGSLLVTPNEQVEHAGGLSMPVDTVGAGDSYTAAMCMALLRNDPLPEVIRKASRVASFVCGERGATPRLPASLTAEFLAERQATVSQA